MGFLDIFRRKKKINFDNQEGFVDALNILTDEVSDLKKRHTAKPEKRIPYDEELAKAGRPWRTDPKTQERYHW